MPTHGPIFESPAERRRRLARSAPPPLFPVVPSPFDDIDVGQVGGIRAFASRGDEPGSGGSTIVPPIGTAPGTPAPAPGGRDSQEPGWSRPGVGDPRPGQEAPTGPRPLPPGTVIRAPAPVVVPPPQPLPLPPVAGAPVYRPPSNDSSVGGPAVVGWDGTVPPSNTGGFDPESRRGAAWDLVNNRPPLLGGRSGSPLTPPPMPGTPSLYDYPDRGRPPLSQAESIIASTLGGTALNPRSPWQARPDEPYFYGERPIDPAKIGGDLINNAFERFKTDNPNANLSVDQFLALPAKGGGTVHDKIKYFAAQQHDNLEGYNESVRGFNQGRLDSAAQLRQSNDRLSAMQNTLDEQIAVGRQNVEQYQRDVASAASTYGAGNELVNDARAQLERQPQPPRPEDWQQLAQIYNRQAQAARARGDEAKANEHTLLAMQAADKAKQTDLIGGLLGAAAQIGLEQTVRTLTGVSLENLGKGAELAAHASVKGVQLFTGSGLSLGQKADQLAQLAQMGEADRAKFMLAGYGLGVISAAIPPLAALLHNGADAAIAQASGKPAPEPVNPLNLPQVLELYDRLATDARKHPVLSGIAYKNEQLGIEWTWGDVYFETAGGLIDALGIGGGAGRRLLASGRNLPSVMRGLAQAEAVYEAAQDAVVFAALRPAAQVAAPVLEAAVRGSRAAADYARTVAQDFDAGLVGAARGVEGALTGMAGRVAESGSPVGAPFRDVPEVRAEARKAPREPLDQRPVPAEPGIYVRSTSTGYGYNVVERTADGAETPLHNVSTYRDARIMAAREAERRGVTLEAAPGAAPRPRVGPVEPTPAPRQAAPTLAEAPIPVEPAPAVGRTGAPTPPEPPVGRVLESDPVPLWRQTKEEAVSTTKYTPDGKNGQHPNDSAADIRTIPVDKIDVTEKHRGSEYLDKLEELENAREPIRVILQPNGRFSLEDGNHRVALAKRKNKAEIIASVQRRHPSGFGLLTAHEASVLDALRTGQPVPQGVRAQFPDLVAYASRQSPSEPPTARVPEPTPEPKPSDSLQAFRASDVATAAKPTEATADAGGHLAALPKAQVEAAVARAEAGGGIPPREPPANGATGGTGGTSPDLAATHARVDAMLEKGRLGEPEVSKSLLTRTGDAVTFTERMISDQNAQAAKMRNRLRKAGIELDDLHDPYLQLRLHPGHGHEAVIDFERGPGRVLELIGKDPEFLTLWERRAKYKQDADIFRNHPDRTLGRGGVRPDQVADLVADTERAIGPERMQRVAEIDTLMREWRGEQLQKGVEAGLWAPETRELLLNMYPDYVPNEILERVYTANLVGKRDLTVSQTGLKKLSDETVDEIINAQTQVAPLTALTNQLIAMNERRNKNLAIRAMGEALQQDPRYGAHVEKLTEYTPSKGVLTWWDNGERQQLRLTKETQWAADVIARLDGDSAHIVARVARWANQGLQAGAIRHNPAWLVAGPVYDLTSVGLREGPFIWVGVAKNWVKLARGANKELEQAYFGARGGMGFAERKPAQLLNELRRSGGQVVSPEGLRQRAKELMLKPVPQVVRRGVSVTTGVVPKLVDMNEKAARLAVFEKYRGKGYSPARAALEARDATLDYSRGGELARALNAFLPFFNASIQGGPLFVARALRDKPAAAATIIGGVTLANLYAYEHNSRYPEYFDIPWYIRGTHFIWMNDSTRQAPLQKHPKTGEPILGKNKEQLREPSYWALPLRDLAPIVMPITWAFDQWFLGGRSQDSFGKVTWEATKGTLPGQQLLDSGLTPNPLSVLIQLRQNRDNFRDRDISPRESSNLPPADRGDEFTGAFSKALAKAIQQHAPEVVQQLLGQVGLRTPQGIEFFIKGNLAGWGDMVTRSLDKAVESAGIEQDGERRKRQSYTGLAPVDTAINRVLRNQGGQVRQDERLGEADRLAQAHGIEAEEVLRQRGERGGALSNAIDVAKAKQVQADEALKQARLSGDPALLAAAAKQWRKDSNLAWTPVRETAGGATYFTPAAGNQPEDQLTIAGADKARSLAAIYNTRYDETKTPAENKRTRQTYLAELQSNDPEGYRLLMDYLGSRGTEEQQRYFKAQEAALRAESLKALDLSEALGERVTASDLDRIKQVKSKYDALPESQKRGLKSSDKPEHQEILDLVRQAERIERLTQRGLTRYDEYLSTDESGKDAVLWNLAQPSGKVKRDEKREDRSKGAVEPPADAFDVTPGQKPVTSATTTQFISNTPGPVADRDAPSEMGSEEVYGDSFQGRLRDTNEPPVYQDNRYQPNGPDQQKPAGGTEQWIPPWRERAPLDRENRPLGAPTPYSAYSKLARPLDADQPTEMGSEEMYGDEAMGRSVKSADELFAGLAPESGATPGAPEASFADYVSGAPESSFADYVSGAPESSFADYVSGAPESSFADYVSGAPESSFADYVSGAPESSFADYVSGAPEGGTTSKASGTGVADFEALDRDLMSQPSTPESSAATPEAAPSTPEPSPQGTEFTPVIDAAKSWRNPKDDRYLSGETAGKQTETEILDEIQRRIGLARGSEDKGDDWQAAEHRAAAALLIERLPAAKRPTEWTPERYLKEAEKFRKAAGRAEDADDAAGARVLAALADSMQARAEGKIGPVAPSPDKEHTARDLETALNRARTSVGELESQHGVYSPQAIKARERRDALEAQLKARQGIEQKATGQPDGAYFNEDTGRWEDQRGKPLPDSDSRQQAVKQQRQQLLGNLPVTPTQASIAMAEALGTNTPAGQQLLEGVRAGKPDASWKAEPLKPDADRTQKAAVAESFGKAVAAIEEKYLPHLPSSVDARKKRAADVLKQYVQTGEYAAGDLGKDGESKAIKGVKSPPALKEYSDARSMATTAFNFATKAPYTYGDDDANEVQRQGTYVERVLKQHGVDVSIRPEVAFEQLSRTDDPKPSDIVYVRDANGRVTFTGVYLGNGQVGTVGPDGKGRLTGVPQGAEFRYVAQPHQGTPFTDRNPRYKRPTVDDLQKPSKAPAWAKPGAGTPTSATTTSTLAGQPVGSPHPDVDTFGSFGGGSPDRQEAQKDKLLAHWRAGGGTPSQTPGASMAWNPTGSNKNPAVAKYAAFIEAAAREQGIPPAAIAALLGVERSAADATSGKGARGLMQVMSNYFTPAALRKLGLDDLAKQAEAGKFDPFDPQTSIRVGAAVFAKEKLAGAKGNLGNGAAAYYGGFDYKNQVTTDADDGSGVTGHEYKARFLARLAEYGGVGAVTGPGGAEGAAQATQGSNLVDTARRYIGTPYQFGAGRGKDTTAVDCSSFISQVAAQHGVTLTPFTDRQAAETQQVSEPKPGDLVFFKGNDPNQPNTKYPHVGIYIGNGMMIDASSGPGKVTERPVSSVGSKYAIEYRRAPGLTSAVASDLDRDPTQGAIRDPRDVGGKPSVNPYVPGQAGFEGNDPAGARMRPGPLPGAPGSGSPGAAPAPASGTGTGGAPAYPGGPIRGTDPPGVLPPRPTDPGQTPDSGSGSRASGGGRQRGGDGSAVPRFRPPAPFELKEERSTSADYLAALLRGGGQMPPIEPFKVDPYRPPTVPIPSIPAPPPLRYRGGDYGVPAPPPLDPEALLRAHQAKLAPLLRRR